MFEQFLSFLRVRFTLAMLLAVVTVAAIVCAIARSYWLAGRERAEVIETLKAEGFNLRYGWEADGQPYPYGPPWLRSIIGDDALNHCVDFVWCPPGMNDQRKGPSANVATLLNRLEYLRDGYVHKLPVLG